MKWIMNQNFTSLHEENKPLECEYCVYPWHELWIQILLHFMKKKPFKCEYSGYPWEIVIQNLASFHEENEPLECEYCGCSWNQ